MKYFFPFLILLSACVRPMAENPSDSVLHPKENEMEETALSEIDQFTETSQESTEDNIISQKETSSPAAVSTLIKQNIENQETVDFGGATPGSDQNPFEGANILEVGYFEDQVIIISIQLRSALDEEVYALLNNEVEYACVSQPELPDRCYCFGPEIVGLQQTELSIYSVKDDGLIARFELKMP
ncbi:MAG: hypothetical protein JEZ06_10670 [Anaerolineaceae bacterium]|nr:hypothetical protein [Anaerolineaceae bacterium]